MAKCERTDCEYNATHSVTLNVPAVGVPIDLHSPIKMYIGVELCRDHAKKFGDGFTWEDNEGLRDAIVATLAAAGRSDADFDRTFHSIVKLDDPGYRQFKQMQADRKKSLS
jgi:hypothetical protein